MKNLKYTPNYCEENIWQLCQHPDLTDVLTRVLFISSLSRNSPLHFQQSSQGEMPVWWDYHVILLASKDGHHSIYDFDTTLPFPSVAQQYLKSTFQEVPMMKPDDRPLFKIVEGDDYISSFHSDRSHMRDADGQWIFEPPTWPLIESEGALSIEGLMDFTTTSSHKLYPLDELIDLVAD